MVIKWRKMKKTHKIGFSRSCSLLFLIGLDIFSSSFFSSLILSSYCTAHFLPLDGSNATTIICKFLK